MRILHSLAPARTGGLEEVVIRLAGGLANRGHEVTVVLIVSPGEGSHPLAAPLEAAGVQIRTLQVPRRAYFRESKGIRAALQETGADVIHTHGYRPDVLHSRVALRSGVPHVTTLHGFTGGDWKNRTYEALQIRAVKRADAVIAVSRPMVDRLRARGVAGDRIHLIPNAWSDRYPSAPRAEARSVLGLEPEAYVVGWVGRLSREKGPDILLDALSRLDESGYVASIVGDGPLNDEIREKARSLSAARTRLHGAVPNAGALFAAFDLFVLSSRTEGTPIALFEAIAARVPVVATAVGGVPDVVGTDAVLVPPGDPAALAEAIRRVRSDPVGAAERAARAAVRVRRDFAPGPWLDRHEVLYASLLRTRSAQG